MRITVGLPSRNRPAGLFAVLTTLDALSSGTHEINYAVIVDDDDYATLEHMEHWQKSGMLPENVHVLPGERVKTVNARFNDAIAEYPADYYMQACDDAYPLAHKWDTLIHALKDVPACSWQEVNDPSNATYLMISERWRQAVGRFYPEYFPFWFADTWIAEVYCLAFAKPIGVVNQLQMGGKRGQTQGMRELAFWFDFFAQTRVERIAEAEAVAKGFGFSLDCESEREEQLEIMRKGDEYQMSRIEPYETAFKSNLGEPSQVYKNAKAAAEIWLYQHVNHEKPAHNYTFKEVFAGLSDAEAAA